MMDVHISARACAVACAVLMAPGHPADRPLVAARLPAAAAPSPGDAIVPFHISVPDRVLTDLKQRLARTRFPDEIDGSGWDYGTSLAYLKDLVTYWRSSFDWRQQERR